MPNFDESLQSIHDINLSYLLLAQQLIRKDKFAAGFRLGLSEGTIDNLKELSLPQLMKLASTNQLICRLRVDDEVVIENLTKDSRIEALQQIHTGIILSTDLLNNLCLHHNAVNEGEKNVR
ncbi:MULTISPECIES: flagellar transcriptional regulator FlhD [Erwinia]|jgi:flagellar transcriptional activator FlhD|uniref:Flagellar transcriptional regulator FlhD n=1 Tax=Erwinia aphidicola TaxID=68334 RepID=A0ABU8DKG9_ERWAP|nr:MULTISPECIES: flagellar transcriptional regulator FlhD [Erwinia]PIJ57847.1 flagellar transcriptional activator FlhD [Erwinia sp. OLMDLW33]MBN1086750.1 flagellar transcriptional regulator FlhD [Erwinia aphidicola]MCP2230190.1 flagellar transcriptional activator FlhD [Erwinia aphidicola]MDI3439591.1 flagellar transcriptional regulator FlhD [Erwinia sp. V90_4]CAH0209235.1 Flagellar transcriptional regulator FlhD [Erwinia aphidicola]